MEDKAAIGQLLKDKLAQLEMKNPTLSEEEVKRQKAELKAELKDADKIMKDNNIANEEKIKQMYLLLVKAVY